MNKKKENTLSKEMLIRMIRGTCELEEYFFFECISSKNPKTTITIHGYRPFNRKNSPYETEYLIMAYENRKESKIISLEVLDITNIVIQIEEFLSPFKGDFYITKEI